MIIRLVRMHFTEVSAPDFLTIFQNSKLAIRNFEGCMHLELLKDVKHANTYTTLSYWRDEKSLNAYRSSTLFGNVWIPVKALFSEPAQAFSFEKFIEL